jgi:hypothetical protein
MRLVVRWGWVHRRDVKRHDMREVRQMSDTNTIEPPVAAEPLSWLELHRIVSLQEASRLSGMSPDTLKRRHAAKIIQLSPRRLGMRVRDALQLNR